MWVIKTPLKKKIWNENFDIFRVLFLWYNGKYFAVVNLKIGDYLTDEKMEKYEIYYDETDEDVWLSEVVKELAIITELIGKYPNQKEKILWYVWFDYKEYSF